MGNRAAAAANRAAARQELGCWILVPPGSSGSASPVRSLRAARSPAGLGTLAGLTDARRPGLRWRWRGATIDVSGAGGSASGCSAVRSFEPSGCCFPPLTSRSALFTSSGEILGRIRTGIAVHGKADEEFLARTRP
uniref:Uncharacterized protein n=1 Tax=Setaria italica TaxID=4555 RepID=K3ZAP0_SETIT